MNEGKEAILYTLFRVNREAKCDVKPAPNTHCFSLYILTIQGIMEVVKCIYQYNRTFYVFFCALDLYFTHNFCFSYRVDSYTRFHK